MEYNVIIDNYTHINVLIMVTITPREKQVLEYLSKGYPCKQIASSLGISEATVITYKNRLRDKLNAQNSNELIYKSTKIGII